MGNLVNDIRSRGISSAYVVAPFDEGKKALESEEYHIISLEENARLRVQEGKDSYVSQHGNWVREGFLYVPGKGKFLTKASLVMINPADATSAHRSRREYSLTDAQVENGLANSVKLKNKGFSIPIRRFGEDEVTVFVFGNFVQNYGTFLKEAGIKEMSVRMINNLGDKPFVRQAWLSRLGYRSRLLGDYRSLYCDSRVRGIREDR